MKLMIKTTFSLSVLLLLTTVANANISLPEIFSDNMVLQRNSEFTFWGWAKPGEPVIIKTSWNNEEVNTKADNQGTWKILVKTPEAGGPFNIQIKGFNEINLLNVLIGEVWLCSGQSNMEWSPKAGINNKEQEIANASYPNIRFFTVTHSTALYPQNHFNGEWQVCTPETMGDFSAIAYFFGQKLNTDLNVPIGLINSSWGGTPAEAWMPEDAFDKDFLLKEAASMQRPVPWGPVESARIYNSMIAPMVQFKIAGALWYQGEGNTINGFAYQELLTALIKSWRSAFKTDFPFYFAQIAPYRYGKPFEGVVVRDEQRKVLEVAKTGMVVTSDIGDTLDIHPKNKKDVGVRLANLALVRHYKIIGVEDSGPLFKSVSFKNNKAVVSFDHAKGLHSNGDKITCFEIAGADKVYYPAIATIKNEQVIVESEKVKNPVSVRFAWRNTATPNLFNGAGLPASCFKIE
jgi:sialate O-acetylesterase